MCSQAVFYVAEWLQNTFAGCRAVLAGRGKHGANQGKLGGRPVMMWTEKVQLFV